MSAYAEFLAAKTAIGGYAGVDVSRLDIHPSLFDWQAEIVCWAARIGRAAIWADTGLGKTRMQLEWARVSGDRALVVAPLAVCQQTVREAHAIGIDAVYARGDDQAKREGIIVTNYEMVDRFDPALLDAVVLDEASILKAHDGATRRTLTDTLAVVPRRLTCTATPAPNDPQELTTQAEFLGRMTRANMLAAYFVHDQDGWRPKGHARGPMFRWMSSWALAIRRPSDLGYDDEGYELPGLKVIPELVDADVEQDGQLFATDLGGVSGRAQVRRATLNQRCDRAVAIVNASHELAAHSDKLAAWDGSPNTPRTGEPSTRPTPRSASDARPKGATRSPTATTCATTTATTRHDSSSTNATPPSDAMPDVGSDTPAIPSTAPSASVLPHCEIPKPGATDDSGAPTASPPRSTTSSSNSKVEDARSAAPTLGTTPGADLPLTTAMSPVASAACSAEAATSDWASSATTPCSSPGPSITSPLEPWIIWCGLNDEQDYLAREFGDRCFSLTGSQDPETKVALLERWLAGERPILVTKTSIVGMGINAQHCARMAFVGLSDSYEAYYQAIRRCYRFGQTRLVHAHVVLSHLEEQVAQNIARKEREASAVTGELVAAMRSSRPEGAIAA